jgi:hypothetical protein
VIVVRAISLIGLMMLAGCAASQEGMLEQSALQTFTSPKSPGEVAGCAQQRLNGGPTMGTDGHNFWVTRQNAWGTAVRYDFRPAPSGTGTVVEYRSRLKINNGMDKVQSCL